MNFETSQKPSNTKPTEGQQKRMMETKHAVYALAQLDFSQEK